MNVDEHWTKMAFSSPQLKSNAFGLFTFVTHHYVSTFAMILFVSFFLLEGFMLLHLLCFYALSHETKKLGIGNKVDSKVKT